MQDNQRFSQQAEESTVSSEVRKPPTWDGTHTWDQEAELEFLCKSYSECGILCCKKTEEINCDDKGDMNCGDKRDMNCGGVEKESKSAPALAALRPGQH